MKVYRIWDNEKEEWFEDYDNNSLFLDIEQARTVAKYFIEKYNYSLIIHIFTLVPESTLAV